MEHSPSDLSGQKSIAGEGDYAIVRGGEGIEGLKNEVICRDNTIRELIPLRLTPCYEAVRIALGGWQHGLTGPPLTRPDSLVAGRRPTVLLGLRFLLFKMGNGAPFLFLP